MEKGLSVQRSEELSIVIPADADRVVRFAARELQGYLKKMLGPAFRSAIRPVSLPGTLLAPGKTKEGGFLLARDATSVAAVDGFSITTGENTISITGANSRSVLYGVYAFLEELGCRFVEPGIEYVPRLGNRLIPPVNKKETAAFALRNIFRESVERKKSAPFSFLQPETVLPQIDWMAKRRLNHHDFYVDYYRYDLWEKYKQPVLEAFLDRGFTLEVTHHSLHYFCPPIEQYDFGGYGPETYILNHPDWYVSSGYGPSSWQTRVDLPGVRKIVTERYLAYLRRNPELSIVGLWPDDGGMNRPFRGLSPTDGYLRFWNEVGRSVAREFPQKSVGIIAYFELIHPPVKVRPKENLHCWFCPIDAQYLVPMTDRRNSHYLKSLGGWVRNMPPLHTGIFEYYGWTPRFIPLREKMREDFRAYRDIGAGGVYAWCGYTDNILGHEYSLALDLFVFTHLIWNPDADVEHLEALWAGTVFGEAHPEILDCYRLLRNAYYPAVKKILAQGPVVYKNVTWITLDTLHRAQKILASGRKKTRDPAVLRRIDLLEKTAANACR